ncbi:MAG: patatin-like phospholipase family protein [Bdellovibrionales bacterium]|nr:patatin-like phospholipase family protein [Bdellovibrionales bacterium]
MRLGNKQRVALCLGGGGIKAAAFHVGACLALQEKGFLFTGGSKAEVAKQVSASENKIPIQVYLGSSAGAIISSYLASGYSVDTLIQSFGMGSEMAPSKDSPSGYLRPLGYKDIYQLNSSGLMNFLPKTFFKKPNVIGGLEVLLKSGFKVNGMFNTSGIEKYLREEALPANRFEQLGVDLYIIATQLNHTRKVVFGNFEQSKKHEHIKWINYANISEAVAASTALPPVFAPYPVKRPDGKEIYYFDGEIRDTLSSHVAEDTGSDLVIASYSLQPYHFNKEMGSLHEYGIPVIINQALYQVVHQKIYRFIREKKKFKEMTEDIQNYFKQNNLPEEHAKKLVEMFCDKFEHKTNVDYIYLHPSPQDHELFFMDHFSFNPKILGKILKIGFLSAIRCLREYGI